MFLKFRKAHAIGDVGEEEIEHLFGGFLRIVNPNASLRLKLGTGVAPSTAWLLRAKPEQLGEQSEHRGTHYGSDSNG
jgi:hypothetical protein